ncbi:hypothetical protein QYF36_019696 [Acer negundo]|nr:hypothetical protein QYF36_019696 [Acer negundo]
MYCSKLVDVGLEGCGFGKSEGLLKGPKVSLSDSTIENKKASDQVSHVDFKSGAEDYSPVCFGNGTLVVVQASGSGLEGKVALSNQDILIDKEEHDRSIKSGGRKKNHLVKRHVASYTKNFKLLAVNFKQPCEL